MTAFGKTTGLKPALEALAAVASVDAMVVENGFIQSLAIATKATGEMTVCRLEVCDASRLYAFYSAGLSEKARRLFAPYPLFHTPPASAGELAGRIGDWKREDDWTALNLVKDGRIIGFGLLKRFKQAEHATSAIVIADEFLKRGLGHLLQMAIVEQARLLKLKGFHIKVISDNLASVRLHEKCGFRQARILPPPLYDEILQYLSDCDTKEGAPPVQRHVAEMVIDFTGVMPCSSPPRASDDEEE